MRMCEAYLPFRAIEPALQLRIRLSDQHNALVGVVISLAAEHDFGAVANDAISGGIVQVAGIDPRHHVAGDERDMGGSESAATPRDVVLPRDELEGADSE